MYYTTMKISTNTKDSFVQSNVSEKVISDICPNLLKYTCTTTETKHLHHGFVAKLIRNNVLCHERTSPATSQRFFCYYVNGN